MKKFREAIWYVFVGIVAIILAYVICSQPVRAESFFHMEAGLGVSVAKDYGDGHWYQMGASGSKRTTTPGYMIGITGDLTNHLAYHADYVYFGEQRASCVCVTDAEYVGHHTTVPGYIPFKSHGHTQGIALTLEGYTWWHGLRFAAEAGPWINWQTWSVWREDPAQPGVDNLDHKTVPNLGLVAGVSVGARNLAISYRYYWQYMQSWNPNPPFVRATHMVMMTYRF